MLDIRSWGGEKRNGKVALTKGENKEKRTNSKLFTLPIKKRELGTG